ncbi:hypothetical protein [Bacillus altitudinis]|uniref:hypothetical protein n=1 Tax=Bacillus altitudinis TaxID=293387 RepID=UPI0009387E4B|nr:hypothetical protein [Bacillus altitudinis]APP15599.1 hypothetical protein BS467_07565 [Bacillus altitudinis]
MTKYKTEKRKAEVGERILITEDGFSLGYYKSGDVFTVSSTTDKGVTGENDCFILHHEYEVIIGEQSPTPNLYEMNYDELVALVEDAMKALRTRSYKNGYDQGRFDAEIEAAHGTYEKSDQQKRDEIVAQAKEDIEALYATELGYRHDFIVNAEKRTVVALRKSFVEGYIRDRGIAKCAPDDCFNAHIGKAIALRRALRLPVPVAYLNVPQPTEIRVGDVVRGTYYAGKGTYVKKIKKIEGGTYYYDHGYDFINDVDLVIIDDSRTGVSE